jgi:hypothetical protein
MHWSSWLELATLITDRTKVSRLEGSVYWWSFVQWT